MAEADDIRPTTTGAKRGSSGVNVERLQNYLAQFGYFDNGVHARFGMVADGVAPTPAKEGEFDAPTEQALRRFQEFFGLEPTGVLDAATLEEMKKPRCGFVDLGNFNAQGNKWDHNNITYGFANFSDDLTEAETRAAIVAAFGYWAAVTPLTFTELGNVDDADIRIRFVAGDHGDGSPFDGPSGVLAHAFYPPPNGGEIAGDAHFDEAETWSVDLPASGIDLHTVAAHEFGHSLGLAHSDVAGALMFPSYSGPNRGLSQDDIDGIQSIYGSEQWHTSKTVVRVFTTYHSRNAWGFIEDVGWRKCKPTSTDGVSNMLGTLCEAKGNGKTVTVLVTDGELEQIYL